MQQFMQKISQIVFYRSIAAYINRSFFIIIRHARKCRKISDKIISVHLGISDFFHSFACSIDISVDQLLSEFQDLVQSFFIFFVEIFEIRQQENICLILSLADNLISDILINPFFSIYSMRRFIACIKPISCIFSFIKHQFQTIHSLFF